MPGPKVSLTRRGSAVVSTIERFHSTCTCTVCKIIETCTRLILHLIIFVTALEQEIPLDLTLRQTSREHTDLSDVEEDEEEDYTDKDLKRLETELSDLQKRFDESMMEKHSLNTMCQDLTTRVKLATNLLDGLV